MFKTTLKSSQETHAIYYCSHYEIPEIIEAFYELQYPELSFRIARNQMFSADWVITEDYIGTDGVKKLYKREHHLDIPLLNYVIVDKFKKNISTITREEFEKYYQ